MELELRLPQLDALDRKIDALSAKFDERLKVLDGVDLTSAFTGADVETCLARLDALDKKIDTLALAAAAPGTVQLDEAPQSEAAAARKRKAAKKSPDPEPVDDSLDEAAEDALRAQCEFEAKRTQRQIGLAGTRAAISRVAGTGVLRVDDVPAARLGELLSTLQAL